MKTKQTLGGFTAIAGFLLIITGYIPVSLIGLALFVGGAKLFGAFDEPKTARR